MSADFASRPAPAVRGFKPDIIGTSLLFLFLVVGQILISVMLWDFDQSIAILEALGIFSGTYSYEIAALVGGLCFAGNAAGGFGLFIVAFGVPGRKMIALVPMLLFLSPILSTFLSPAFMNMVGWTSWNYYLFWFVTHGIFYGVALAAWAYGFGRSTAGVVAAGLLGVVLLMAYQIVMGEWVSLWLQGMADSNVANAIVTVINSVGFDLVIVAAIALSCLVGPGLARAPIAPRPFYGQPLAPQPSAVPQPPAAHPSAGPQVDAPPAHSRPGLDQRPAVPTRYVAGALTWDQQDTQQQT